MTRDPRFAELDALITREQNLPASRYKRRKHSHDRYKEMRRRMAQRTKTLDPIVRTFDPPAKIQRVISRAAERYSVPEDWITRGRKTFSDVTKARRLIIGQLRRRGLSYPLIGFYLGMHHTSVRALFLSRK